MRELALNLGRGATAEEAARRASVSAERVGRRKRTREMADLIRKGVVEHHSDDVAPQAVRVVNSIMSNKNTPAKVRLRAAKTLLDRAGNEARVGVALRTHDGRTLAKPSAEELRRRIEDF